MSKCLDSMELFILQQGASEYINNNEHGVVEVP